jgi:nuclease HARBI1
MSRVREAVEWGFNDVITQFAFLDFKRSMKIYLSPIAAYYMVGMFLTNIRVCLYGNTCSSYFSAENMTVEEYLDMVDILFPDNEDNENH